MSRLERLQSLYLKIVYFQIAEEKDPECSPAVLEACRVAKDAVRRDYYAIIDRRGGKP